MCVCLCVPFIINIIIVPFTASPRFCLARKWQSLTSVKCRYCHTNVSQTNHPWRFSAGTINHLHHVSSPSSWPSTKVRVVMGAMSFRGWLRTMVGRAPNAKDGFVSLACVGRYRLSFVWGNGTSQPIKLECLPSFERGFRPVKLVVGAEYSWATGRDAPRSEMKDGMLWDFYLHKRTSARC